MVKTYASIKSIQIGLGRVFKGYKSATLDERETETYIKLGKGKYSWIDDIKAINKAGAATTTIFIGVSYPKFFTNDSNVVLIGSEAKRVQVNNNLKRLLEDICKDTVCWGTAKYLRVDVAQEFEDIFEEYYNVFDVLYRTHIEGLGNGNRESKKFLQEEYAIEPRDYTTGYRYKKGEYISTLYNKTLHDKLRKKEAYKPFGETKGRIEQAFSPKVLGKKTLLVEETTMEVLREAYKVFLSRVIVENINKVLKNQSETLYSKLEKSLDVKNPKIKAEVKDMTHLILDEEQAIRCISHLPLKVTDRQKRRYKSWIRESLDDTSKEGQFKRTFKGNFDRLINIVKLMTGVKLQLEWSNHIPNLQLA